MHYQWLDIEEYPFKSHYFEIEGNQLHYLDEGEGDVLLFVHGTPSWSFDFRHVISELCKEYRCIAIDHIGFGLSDKPQQYDYSTTHHSATLEHFILEKELRDITLVVHDFGGPIGLNVAIRHPEKFKKLVVLNSWLWSSKSDPDFIRLSKILRSPVLPFIYRYFNFSPRFILPQSFGDNKINKHTLRQYTRPFANTRQRNGTLAFAKSLLNDQDWFESLWHKKTTITGKPTLFIWGMKDPVIKPRHLEKFRTGFKNASTCTLERCGHFPQEEAPVEVTEAIRVFLKK